MKHAIIIFVLIINHTSFSQQIDLWKGLDAGDYEVGFKTFEVFDKSRPALKEQRVKDKGRAMQVSVWYPAENSQSAALHLDDYLLLRGNEINFSTDKDVVKNTSLHVLASDFQSSATAIEKQLFPIVMKAKGSPASVKNKFPVVLMVHNNAVGYSLIGELLASHGFIVATSPMTGTSSKEFDWQTVQGIETEVSDMEFVYEIVSKNFSNADLSKVATLGHSYGAMAAIAYQSRHDNVMATVSLDGGIGKSLRWTHAVDHARLRHREDQQTTASPVV